MHELRKDPLLSRWVGVLAESLPPGSYAEGRPNIPDKDCLLCGDGGLVETASLKGQGGASWAVRSVKSPVPLLVPSVGLGRKGIGLYDRMNGVGENEVIIESPEHDVNPEDIGANHMGLVFKLQVERLRELAGDERVRYVMVSKDSGEFSAPVFSHPHSQIIAAPVIPLRIKAELDGAKAYYSYKERCIFCDIIDQELRAGLRVVMETEHFIAFCPFAPRFPFETWVVPRRHRCDIQSASEKELEDLGGIMASLIKKLRKVLREPSYGYMVHTAPMRIPKRNHWHSLGDDFHWHIEMAPRFSGSAGVEWGAGFYVLATSPEAAAGYLKEA